MGKIDKKEYYHNLRERWQQAKKLSETKEDQIKAIIATHGLNISNTGFVIVAQQLKEQGLKGLPYLDAKTYKGWIENGFQVQKGQKSTLSGVTWIDVKGKADNEEDNGYMMPKEYKLFHRTQVEAVAV